MSAPQPDERLIEAWARLWNVPDLAARVRLEWSDRLRASAGRCHPASGRIRLSTALPPDQIANTLCHEAAHVAARILHGPGIAPHGPEWRALMDRARPEWRAEAAPARPSPPKPRAVYLHRCPICHYTRRDRARAPRYACPACREAGRMVALEVVAMYRPATDA